MNNQVVDDEPLTLDEACRFIFKGAITPATLRAEAQRGRLIIERIGRRDFVTRAALREMRKKCEVDRSQKDQGSGFSRNERTPMEASKSPDGSSGTDQSSAARDALLMTLEELSKPSPATSRRSINRRSGAVIHLKR